MTKRMTQGRAFASAKAAVSLTLLPDGCYTAKDTTTDAWSARFGQYNNAAQYRDRLRAAHAVRLLLGCPRALNYADGYLLTPGADWVMAVRAALKAFPPEIQ